MEQEIQGNEVVNSTTQVDATTLPNAPTKVEFTQEQQEKVNALIKQERDRVLGKLGISSVDEGKSKLETLKDFGTYKEKASAYDTLLSEKKELEGTNAMLNVGISEDMRDVVRGYFKGSNQDLTTENLNKLFQDKPKLKEQWVGKVEQPKEVVNIGNPRQQPKDNDDLYSEFRKYTKY